MVAVPILTKRKRRRIESTDSTDETTLEVREILHFDSRIFCPSIRKTGNERRNWRLHWTSLTHPKHPLETAYQQRGTARKSKKSFGSCHRLKLAGHCWRSSEVPSGLVMWKPTFGQGKQGRPLLDFITLLNKDTGLNSLDLKAAM